MNYQKNYRPRRPVAPGAVRLDNLLNRLRLTAAPSFLSPGAWTVMSPMNLPVNLHRVELPLLPKDFLGPLCLGLGKSPRHPMVEKANPPVLNNNWPTPFPTPSEQPGKKKDKKSDRKDTLVSQFAFA